MNQTTYIVNTAKSITGLNQMSDLIQTKFKVISLGSAVREQNKYEFQ